MENQYEQKSYSNSPESLPNSTATLVLGIISIVTCFCYGIIGLACGITAIVLSSKSLRLYNANKDAYSVSSYNNLKAGRICAIIGVCLSSIYVAIIIVYLAIFGTIILSNPNIFSNHSF